MSKVVAVSSSGAVAYVKIGGRSMFRICDQLRELGIADGIAGKMNTTFRQTFSSLDFRLVKPSEASKYGWYADVRLMKHLELYATDPSALSAANASFYSAIAAGKKKKVERLKAGLREACATLPLEEIVEALGATIEMKLIDATINELRADNAKLRTFVQGVKPLLKGLKFRIENGRAVVRVPAPSRCRAA